MEKHWIIRLLGIKNKASGIKRINFALASVMEERERRELVFKCKRLFTYVISLFILISVLLGRHYFTHFRKEKLKFKEAGWIVIQSHTTSFYLSPNLHSSKVHFLSTIPCLFSGKILFTCSKACQSSSWKVSVILSSKAIYNMTWFYKSADLVQVT